MGGWNGFQHVLVHTCTQIIRVSPPSSPRGSPLKRPADQRGPGMDRKSTNPKREGTIFIHLPKPPSKQQKHNMYNHLPQNVYYVTNVLDIVCCSITSFCWLFRYSRHPDVPDPGGFWPLFSDGVKKCMQCLVIYSLNWSQQVIRDTSCTKHCYLPKTYPMIPSILPHLVLHITQDDWTLTQRIGHQACCSRLSSS